MQELLNILNNPTIGLLILFSPIGYSRVACIGYQNGGGYVLSIMHDRQSGGAVCGDDCPPLRFRKSR